MRRALAFVVVAGLAGLAGVAGFIFATGKPEIAPAREVKDYGRKVVSQGETLAALGSCAYCHTRDGGKPYAGGRAIETPFGTLYSSNITPHKESGIGQWSLAAFTRAMREGVSRSGAYLYPAFPYDHFSRVNDEDIEALYAYFMQGVSPQADKTPANAMSFPFNVRQGLAVWNALFLKPEAPKPGPGQDAEWARGAYLAEGLGHCGACHSPRNALGAIDAKRAYAGAFVNGWYAPALDASSPAPIPWTKTALVNYLMDGWDKHHGLAAGSMGPVSSNLRDQKEDDMFALAAYVVSLAGPAKSPQAQAEAERKAMARVDKTEWDPARDNAPPNEIADPGQRLFQTRCAECHKKGGKPAPLALNSALNLPDPTNVVRATFEGIKPPQGALDRSMPAFRNQITEADMVAVVKFMRARFTEREPWANLEEIVRRESQRR
jgi:mono/diheme cytochrome c family protein